MTDSKDLTTEQKILEAAKKVFLQRGLDGARMEEIAAEAGINKALLHYYFRSKDKLFENVLDSVGSKFLPDLTTVMESNEPTLVKIESVVTQYVGFLLQNPQLPLFIISEFSRNPDRMRTVMSQTQNFGRMQQFGLQLVTEMELGKIKPFNPLHLTLNIVALCVFPFAARPMAQTIFSINDADYEVLLSQRKTEIMEFLRAALAPI